jgi:hypothetical protein
MKSSLFILLVFFIHSYSNAQDSTSRMKVFRISVFQEQSTVKSGILASMSDTGFALVKKASSVLHPAHDQEYINFHYSDVNKIYVRRRGAVGKGALIGGLSGFAVGVIAGFVEGDDPPCVSTGQDFFGIGTALCNAFRMTAGEKAGLYGTGGLVAGAVIGLAVGAVAHKKFIIGKKKDQFQAMQLTILERLYVNGNR